MTAETTQLMMVALDNLVESATNPRKTFNPTKLQELADSIKSKGVLQPLIVRPREELTSFEIIAGARRLRASKLAGVDTAPCIVRPMPDKDVLEFQLIENNQREDVDPIEESEGYARLIADHGHTVSSLALKVGKSERHIAARISLRDLGANARALLQAERLKIGHAELLSRLPLDQQEYILEHFDLHVDDAYQLDLSISELRQWIEDRLYRSLVKAPFPLNKKGIVIGVPSCIQCPNNSASQGALFDDTTQAWCTDKSCFDMKVDNWTLQQQAKLKDEAVPFVQITDTWKGDRQTQSLPRECYEPAGSGDEGAVLALVTAGEHKGQTKYVVLNDQAAKFLETCTKPEREKAPAKSWQEEQAERELKAKKLGQLRSKLRLLTIRAIFDFEDGQPSAAKLRILLRPRLFTEQGRNLFVELLGLDEKQFAKGIPDKYFDDIEDTDQFLKVAIAAQLCNDLQSRGYEPLDLTNEQQAFANLYGIDVKQLKKTAQTELKAEEKAEADAADQKKAGKKASKKKAEAKPAAAKKSKSKPKAKKK